RDTTPGLLACSLAEDGRSITRYRRGAAATLSDTVPFTPLLLLADEKALTGARGVVSLSRLDGPGQLGRLTAFETWRDAMAARDRCRAAGAAHRFFADPVQQYLLLSGCTLFGGLRFSDLRGLSLDIEVITSEGFEFPSASRPGDRIVAIALSDTTGWVEVLRGDRMSEPDLLLECGRLIRERDPAVVEGHNIFRFDLEYLDARARLPGRVRATVLRAGAARPVRLPGDGPARRGREDRRAAAARVSPPRPGGAVAATAGARRRRSRRGLPAGRRAAGAARRRDVALS